MDGGPPSKVIPIPSSVSITAGVRWTPDGLHLNYVDGRNDGDNIWSQPLDGTPAKKIADFAPDRIFSFDWSRDGKNMAVARGTVTSDVVLIKDQP